MVKKQTSIYLTALLTKSFKESFSLNEQKLRIKTLCVEEPEPRRNIENRQALNKPVEGW